MLIQFGRIELERPDALVWMQNGKFYEVYGDVARLLGRLLDLRVAEKPLMTGRNGHPFGIAIGTNGAFVASTARATPPQGTHGGPHETAAVSAWIYRVCLKRVYRANNGRRE